MRRLVGRVGFALLILAATVPWGAATAGAAEAVPAVRSFVCPAGTSPQVCATANSIEAALRAAGMSKTAAGSAALDMLDDLQPPLPDGSEFCSSRPDLAAALGVSCGSDVEAWLGSLADAYARASSSFLNVLADLAGYDPYANVPIEVRTAACVLFPGSDLCPPFVPAPDAPMAWTAYGPTPKYDGPLTGATVTPSGNWAIAMIIPTYIGMAGDGATDKWDAPAIWETTTPDDSYPDQVSRASLRIELHRSGNTVTYFRLWACTQHYGMGFNCGQLSEGSQWFAIGQSIGVYYAYDPNIGGATGEYGFKLPGGTMHSAWIDADLALASRSLRPTTTYMAGNENVRAAVYDNQPNGVRSLGYNKTATLTGAEAPLGDIAPEEVPYEWAQPTDDNPTTRTNPIITPGLDPENPGPPPSIDPSPSASPNTTVANPSTETETQTNAIGGFFDNLANAIGSGLSWLGDIFGSWIRWLLRELAKWFEWLGNQLITLLQWIGSLLNIVIDWLRLIRDAIVSLSSVMVTALQAVVGAVQQVVVAIGQLLGSLVDVLSTWFQAVIDAVMSIPDLILDGLGFLFIPSAVPELPACSDVFPCSWVAEAADAATIISDGAGDGAAGSCVAPGLGWSEFKVSFPPPSGCAAAPGSVPLVDDHDAGNLFGYRVALRAAAFLAFGLLFVMRVVQMTPWAESRYYQQNPTQQTMFG